MKAVLDPNVLTSSLLSRDGRPAKVVFEWLHGGFDLVVSQQLLQELEETLAYPKIQKRVKREDAERFIALLRLSATTAEDPSDEPPIHSRDVKDDYLLALAAKESAVLVTGDKDLLNLTGTFPIYDPKQFLDLLVR